MACKLITMLTWHDVTVPDAKEIFLSAKDAPCDQWGFKIEGTTPESFADLAACMKENGKETFIEVLAMSEEDCITAARQCIAGGVDHMLGTPYWPSVQEMLGEAGISYSPFPALDPDSRIRRPVKDVVADIAEKEAAGVDGITLSAFRYLGEEGPEALLASVDANVTKPFRIAGSVNTFERIDYLKTLNNLAGFTIGGAFFEKRFGDSFAENITAVANRLAE